MELFSTAIIMGIFAACGIGMSVFFMTSVNKRDMALLRVVTDTSEVVERNTAASLALKETVEQYGRELADSIKSNKK